MRRGFVWMLGAALGVGLAAVARAEPDDDAEPAAEKSSRLWVSPIFSIFKKSPEQKTPEDAPKEEMHPPDRKAVAEAAATRRKMAQVEDIAAKRDREWKTCVRRLEVCDKLRAIAVQNNDETLARKIDQLEAQAWSMYQQRMANLSGGNAGDRLDEGILDRHLGSAESQPADAARNVNSNGRAAARGDMP